MHEQLYKFDLSYINSIQALWNPCWEHWIWICWKCLHQIHHESYRFWWFQRIQMNFKEIILL